jgi:Rrf2 family transcriptional regulator, iron-sulfur cluster assembly transcription factor
MFFSKSFGYAVRGILYIANVQEEKKYVHVEEIAQKLAVPRHFMGKILKGLAKKQYVQSVKGPSGGFSINESTMKVTLLELVDSMDGLETFRSCVLRLKECNSLNPCPLHLQMEGLKSRLRTVLSGTTIEDMMNENKDDFLKSISTEVDINF